MIAEPQKSIGSSSGAMIPYGNGGGYFQEAAAEEYRPKLSLRTLVEACFRHPLRLAIFTGLPLLVTFLLITFMPKRYMATMQLVVLNNRQYSVITSESDEPAKVVGGVSDSDVNSQAQLLLSRDVLNQTLDQLRQPSAPAVLRDKAIVGLEEKLNVEPVRDSNILNVSYSDSSPAKAKETLQALASSFVERELALLRPVHGQQLFANLVNDRQHELAAAQDQFAKFKIETGIASLKDDEATLLRQLESSSSQSATLEAELALQRQSATKTGSELSQHPDRITTQNRSTPNQSAIEALTSKLVELENKRTSLLTGYQPTERVVQEVDQQIKNVQEQLADLRAGNAMETTTDVNPLNLELKSQLAKAQISSTALEAQRRSVAAQRRAYALQLDQLEGKGPQFETLQKQVIEAQRNLDLASQKRDQAAVDDALDRERILNVAFAAKPSASSLPVAPRPSLYLALGLFTAIFLGLGSCVIAEMGRDTIYSPAELDALTGVTTLVALPLDPWRRSDRGDKLDEEGHLSTTALAAITDNASPSASFHPLIARSKQ